MQLDLLNCQDFHKHILPKMSELPANQIFPRENLNIKVQRVADSQHSDTFLHHQVFKQNLLKLSQLSYPLNIKAQSRPFLKIFDLPLQEAILNGRWRCSWYYYFAATSSGRKLYNSVLLFWSEKKFYQVHFPAKNLRPTRTWCVSTRRDPSWGGTGDFRDR